MKVVVLTTGRFTPSTRFRIRQHIKPLTEYGIQVREYSPFLNKGPPFLGVPRSMSVLQFPPAWPLVACQVVAQISTLIPGLLAARDADVLWLERGLYPGIPSFERFLSKPLVLDVDDAVWHARPFGERQMRLTAERADIITVCNSHLANWFSQYNKNIELVPTSVDGERFFPQTRTPRAEFIVGWTGTSSNFDCLYDIQEALGTFLRHAPSARLRVVADRPPLDLGLPTKRIDFHRWSEDNEVALVQSMDVGIMPMADSDWNRGKCAFKMLQYMACGLPVVASPVGMSAEVLGCGELGYPASTLSEWTDALVHLYENPDVASRFGIAGRAVFERTYSRKVVTEKLARIFRRTLACA